MKHSILKPHEMRNNRITPFKKVLLVGFLLLSGLPAWAQMRPGQIDIFAGVDFNYRDIFHNDRLYDVLINLTPGIKWNMRNRWEASAQVVIPVVNQFGEGFSNKVRLNMAVLSKQFPIKNRMKVKLSGGLFGASRYGLDVKSMWIANKWLAFTGQAGLTGYCSLASGWEASTMKRLTFLIGPESWLESWTTQMWIKAGRFIYGDYGVQAEAFRHFKHTSVGIFASYSDIGKENAGFKIILALPPYKRTRRKINFRPASNFRLTYNVSSDYYSNRQYFTDPEQNERNGWFDRDMLPWGPDTMSPDFIYKDRKEER